MNTILGLVATHLTPPTTTTGGIKPPFRNKVFHTLQTPAKPSPNMTSSALHTVLQTNRDALGKSSASAKQYITDMDKVIAKYYDSIPKLDSGASFRAYDKAFLQYIGLLHQPLTQILTDVAGMDFSPFRYTGTTTPLLPSLPPDVPHIVVLQATSAILNKLSPDLHYLVSSCGPMDLLQAYAALIIHFAPNDSDSRSKSTGTFYLMHILSTQNVKMYAATLVKQANVVNLHHGCSKIDQSDLRDQLLRGLTVDGGCSNEQASIYKDALYHLKLQPNLALQSTITFIAQQSDEQPPASASMALTRGGHSGGRGGKGGGRGGGRGGKGGGRSGGKGGKGGKGSGPQPNPNRNGTANWKDTYLSGINPDGVPIVGKGVPIEETTAVSKLLCPFRLKFGKCTRPNCEYNHNYNVNIIPPTNANAQALQGPQSDASSSSSAHAQVPGGPNLHQSSAWDHAHAGSAHQSATSHNFDLQSGSSDGYDADAFKMPTIDNYMPRGPDTGYRAVGNVAYSNQSFSPTWEPIADVPSEAQSKGLTALLLFYVSIFLSVFSLAKYFVTIPVSALRLTVSLLRSVTDGRPILSFALLPVLLSLTIVDVCFSAGTIFATYLTSSCCRDRGNQTPMCRRVNKRQHLPRHVLRDVRTQQAAMATHSSTPSRTLPILEDSGCSGIMSGDMDQSIGPKRPLRVPITVANHATAWSSHVSKISLDGQLVDCLFVPGFHQTLVSKGSMVKMGYLPTTNASGRTDYVDSNGRIFLSFQLQNDNLFHLHEHNRNDNTKYAPHVTSTSSSFSSSF